MGSRTVTVLRDTACDSRQDSQSACAGKVSLLPWLSGSTTGANRHYDEHNSRQVAPVSEWHNLLRVDQRPTERRYIAKLEFSA